MVLFKCFIEAVLVLRFRFLINHKNNSYYESGLLFLFYFALSFLTYNNYIHVYAASILFIMSFAYLGFKKGIKCIIKNVLYSIIMFMLIYISYHSINIFDAIVPEMSDATVFTSQTLLSAGILLVLIEILGDSLADNSYINVFALYIALVLSLYVLFFYGYAKEYINGYLMFASICMFSILALIMNYLFKNQRENLEEKRKNEILNKELSFNRQNIEKLLNNEIETRRIRHNLRHFILLIKEYIKNNDINQIDILIDNQLNHIDELGCNIKTGNDSIDLILSYYLPIMKEKNIHFTSNYYKGMPNIDKLDFYTIFGNALENAIEHCQSDNIKNISLDVGKTIDERYYFKIKNSILVNQKVELTQSSKNEVGHGYGVSSIMNLVEKHDGYVDFIKKDKSFSIVVILP